MCKRIDNVIRYRKQRLCNRYRLALLLNILFTSPVKCLVKEEKTRYIEL